VDKGRKLVARFVQDLADVAMVERNDGLEGKAILLYLTRIAPVKKKESVTAPSVATPSVTASSTKPASPITVPPKTE
jgi:hypothetical protein